MAPPTKDTTSSTLLSYVCSAFERVTGGEALPAMFLCYYTNEYCAVDRNAVRSKSCGHIHNHIHLYPQLLDQNGFALCLHRTENGVCGASVDPEMAKSSSFSYDRIQRLRAKTARKCRHCQHEQPVDIANGWMWRCDQCSQMSCVMHGKDHDEHTLCLDYEIETQKKKTRDFVAKDLKEADPKRIVACPRCSSQVPPAERSGSVYLHCFSCDASFCGSCRQEVEGADAVKAHYGQESKSPCAGQLEFN